MDKDHTKGLNGAVAAVLKGEKAAAGLTIPQLAERSGIPAVSLRRYLACERAIDVELLEALAGALGMSSGDVIEAAQQRLSRDAHLAESIDRIQRARKVDRSSSKGA